MHNLGRIDPRWPDAGTDWARRFDDEVRERHDLGAPAAVAELEGHADYALAVPTPDHFIPLLYLAGLAEAAGQPRRRAGRGLRLRVAVDDRLHARRRLRPGARRSRRADTPGTGLPDVPADETNL